MSIAVVFPGQGSHRAGALDAWALGASSATPSAALIDSISAAISRDVAALVADEATGARTADAQPAIFAASMVAWATLEPSLLEAGFTPAFVAGHSLGEFTAAVAAGSLSLEDGARLVAARGAAMAEACRLNPGTMAAIVKLDPEAVEALVAEVEDVVVANDNAPGQVVVAGPVDAVTAVRERAREMGGRGLALDVEGAFHSPAMAPAVDRVATIVTELAFHDAEVPLVSGTNGLPLSAGPAIAEALVEGMLAPVRWRAVQQTFEGAGVTDLIEVGPGGVLAGLAKRALPSVRTHRVEQPEDVAPVIDRLAAGGADAGSRTRREVDR